MDPLLEDTMAFFLRSMVRILVDEVDLRARCGDRNPVFRGVIWASALARDLFRIPTHNPAGIGQARFRARVAWISETAIPTLRFFSSRYPLDVRRRAVMAESVECLERAVGLLHDGRIAVLDEWYASMREFRELAEHCRQAAAKIEEVLRHPDPCAPG